MASPPASSPAGTPGESHPYGSSRRATRRQILRAGVTLLVYTAPVVRSFAVEPRALLEPSAAPQEGGGQILPKPKKPKKKKPKGKKPGKVSPD